MYAVLFEVEIKAEYKDEYLEIAKNMMQEVAAQKGFISIERFQSLSEPQKLLSLSYWQDQESIAEWKSNKKHQVAQQKGKEKLFNYYRIKVTKVEKDYSILDTSTVSESV